MALLTFFYRLLPANPILLRVVETGGKRMRDLIVRCVYLGLLIVVVLLSLASTPGSMSLTQLSDQSVKIFESMSYLQLGLVALLGPVFTAGAITQERDSQTYDVLLTTPLSNAQIVLGSLLSRLFFVVALLISGIPVFSVTQVFGGVAIRDIALSFSIAAATAFVTGALAMAIATLKVGTRRTIFSFYLFIVIYLVGLYLLDTVEYFHIAGPTRGQKTSHISWFTGLHPFLALRVVLGTPDYQPPDIALLPLALRGWPLRWYFTNPAGFYISFMFLLSALLVMPSIIMLRRLAQSTVSFNGWLMQLVKLDKGNRTRKPRTVWGNPIAWREAKTKASAARASFVRYGFILVGIAGSVVLLVLYATPSAKPSKYITRFDYHPATATTEGTLFVNGDQLYGLAPNVEVILNGKAASVVALQGDFAVDNFSQALSARKTKQITSIVLSDIPSVLQIKPLRSYLLGAVILEFAVIMLIVTNAAASTVTREKEDGSLDLLLTTPITSRYYIWGKLRGLVSFVMPLVAVPVVSVSVFIVYDLFRVARGVNPSFQWIVFPEAIAILPGMLIIVTAFASILGMQMSLRCRTTVRAVMSSIAIIVGVCGLMGFCGTRFSDMRPDAGFNIGMAFSAFSPFTVFTILIDPYTFASNTFEGVSDDGTTAITARTVLFICSLIATAVYTGVVWAMYTSMVKNFDMTIRRQSR